MIKKIKKSIVACGAVASLVGLFGGTAVSGAQVATVLNTRYEIHYVFGPTTNHYTWKDLYYNKGFTQRVSSVRKDYGMNPAFLYTYHYTTY